MSDLSTDERRSIEHEIDTILVDWRKRALNQVYLVTVVLGLLGLIGQVYSDLFVARTTPVGSLVFAALYGLTVWMSFHRKLPARVRSWALIALVYLAGMLSLARGSLPGDGRLLLLILPFAALVLIGQNAALFSLGVSITSLVGFALAAVLGWTNPFRIDPLSAAPSALNYWLIEGFYTILLMVFLAALALVFYRFLLQILKDEIYTQREVSTVHLRLDEARQDAVQDYSRSHAQSSQPLQEALTQAQSELAESRADSRAKGALLSTVSHDLRSLMGALMGMLSLIEDTSLSLQQKEYTDLLRQTSDQLLQKINDLLDFTRLEEGRLVMDEKTFEVRDCITRAVLFAGPFAAERKLELVEKVMEGVPQKVMGDPARLGQALGNLLICALRLADGGKVTLTAAPLAPPAEGHANLEFTIHADWTHANPQYLWHLLHPFEEGGALEGGWLEPVLAQRMTTWMGGELISSAEKGAGVNFHVRLSLRLPAPEPAATQAAALRWSQRRVLILDPSAASRHTLSMQVQAWGMTPRATASLNEAGNWLAQGERFNALVMDVEAGGDAPLAAVSELAQPLKPSQPGLPSPVLLIVPEGQQVPPEDGQPFTTLVKPYKASQLFDILQMFFTTDLSRPAAGSPETAPSAAQEAQNVFDSQEAQRNPLDILIVEDNFINRKMMTQIIEHMGYQPGLASSGGEALEALRRQPYDVVLMDVQMPVMDGMEVTRRVRADFTPAMQPRIIAMTAKTLPGDRDVCLQAGMDDYLAKPIHLEALTAALRRCRRIEKPAALPPARDDQPILDRSLLNDLSNALGARSAQLMPALAQNFKSQSEGLLEGISQALSAGTCEEAERLAGLLNANCAGIGALRMASACADLADCASRGDTLTARAWFERCVEEYERVKKEV